MQVEGAGTNVAFIKGEALEAIGICREATGDIDGALDYYNKSVKSSSAPHRIPAIKWKIALIEKSKGNKDAALKRCDELISDTTATAFKSGAENLKAVIEAL